MGPSYPSGDPPNRAAAYLAAQPSIGQGMLDTLRMLYGQPITYDTTRSNSLVAAQYTPGRVVVNPARIEHWASMPPGARTTAGYTGLERAATLPAQTLAHEVIGHGVAGTRNEKQADYWARAFLRLSGRDPNLPYLNAQDMAVEVKLRQMLQTLNPTTERK